MTEIEWITGSPPDAPSPAALATTDWADRPTIELFERIANRYPDRPAVDDGVISLTYAELRRAVRRLAVRIEREAPPGRPVAALMHNGAAFPIIQLALAATARPIVAIDAASPAERQAVILRESGVGAVVALDDPEIALDAIPPDVPQIIFRPDASAGAPPLPAVEHDLDGPMTITFTSGSTGQPKGIAHSQRGSHHVVADYVAANDIGPGSVILGLASLSAGGPRESLSALLTGGRVRFVDMKRIGLLESLRVMRDDRVTMLGFLPSPLRMMMQLPGIEDALAHLQVLDLAGEATTAADIALFRSKLPATCRIALGLGSIDASLLCRWFVEDARIGGAIAPVGNVIAGRCVAIVDEAGRSVPRGEIGELIASDDKTAMGYWRAGRLDPASFVPAPGEPGPRTCRTGDLVRMRHDGLVEFAGRVDRMVKIRGLRADLDEIEAALRAIEAIDEAAVVALDREGDSTLLAAFVTTPDLTEPFDDAAVRRRVAAATAPHMVPHVIRVLPALPRLHGGKADLVRLAEMARTPPSPQHPGR